MKSKSEKHCMSIDCPERFSLCCHAGCTNGKEGEPHFVCIKCRKEFVSPPCTAGDELGKTLTEEKYDELYKEQKTVGKFLWLMLGSVVFIILLLGFLLSTIIK